MKDAGQKNFRLNGSIVFERAVQQCPSRDPYFILLILCGSFRGLKKEGNDAPPGDAALPPAGMFDGGAFASLFSHYFVFGLLVVNGSACSPNSRSDQGAFLSPRQGANARARERAAADNCRLFLLGTVPHVIRVPLHGPSFADHRAGGKGRENAQQKREY